jgi:hypothetical protein
MAKEMTKEEKDPEETAFHTYSDRVILNWQLEQCKRTVNYRKINIPVIRSSPTYNNFSEHLKLNKNPEITMANAAMVP